MNLKVGDQLIFRKGKHGEQIGQVTSIIGTDKFYNDTGELQYMVKTMKDGSGMVDIYKYYKNNETRFAAEYCHRTAIDDYDITSYIYSQEPGNKTILETKALEDIDWEFIRHREPVIRCWECGHECHFADIVARDMEQKLDRWQEGFCGRCDKT